MICDTFNLLNHSLAPRTGQKKKKIRIEGYPASRRPFDLTRKVWSLPLPDFLGRSKRPLLAGQLKVFAVGGLA